MVLDALGIQEFGGCRSATLNLIEGLIQEQSDDELVVLLSQAELFSGNGRRLRQIIFPSQGRMRDRVRLQFVLPRLLRELKADVVHHVKNLTTFWVPCKQVVTLHDLTILRHPDMFPKFEVAYWRSLERLALKAADHVIAISSATADDLSRYYGLSAQKLTVIYNSYDPIFSPVRTSNDSVVRSMFGLTGDYVLHVGNIWKKKNLPTLVDAFALLVKDHGFAGKLALVGHEYHKGREPALIDRIRSLGLEDRVVLTGAVSQEDLASLYRGAAVFVFPSFHEGFGLGPIEAMASGVPVVAYASEAVREVVADAAVLVDGARDARALAEAVRYALDSSVRDTLVEAGIRQAQRFSRSRQGRQTWELYRRVTGSPASVAGKRSA